METHKQNMIFKDAKMCFENAIKEGRLSENVSAYNYAGRFMYMGTKIDENGKEKDLFKNINTRNYLE